MSDNYTPEIGDRVRVTLEGTVDMLVDSGKGGFWLKGSFLGDSRADANNITSVEKIEPPVEVFKDGDRLRYKAFHFEVTLGHGGYLRHSDNVWVAYKAGKTHESSGFTSRSYEKIA